MIHKIPHTVSEGLQKENEVHDQRTHFWTKELILEKFPSKQHFCDAFLKGPNGSQLIAGLPSLSPQARILEIGAGFGHASVFMASEGFQVTVIEPSLGLCRFIELAAEVYEVPLEIYQVTAEEMNRIDQSNFDGVLFNASLHHCDNPVRALANCYDLLSENGILLVLNEPHLQFFRSKDWFYSSLAEGKLAAEDYGGNEHTYYYREYISMMKAAGFAISQEFLSCRYTNSKEYLHYLKSINSSSWKFWPRLMVYKFLAILNHLGPIGKPALFLMKQMSLLQTNYIGKKRKAA